jgi:hypothetical protein
MYLKFCQDENINFWGNNNIILLEMNNIPHTFQNQSVFTFILKSPRFLAPKMCNLLIGTYALCFCIVLKERIIISSYSFFKNSGFSNVLLKDLSNILSFLTTINK